MKITLQELRQLVREELLRESPFQINSIEADYNEVPVSLQHAIQMLVSNFRVEMVKPQSRYGSKGEDDAIVRAHRQKSVKNRATALHKKLSAMVSDAVRELN